MSKKVLVAISGGVDSSTAALLLKKQGYEVMCAHMKLWVDVDNSVVKDSVAACPMICDFLEVPFFLIDLSQQFKSSIIEYFVDEYKAGRTPNPCVKCNKEIKWTAFIKKADELGCDYIATGHYVRIELLEGGRWTVKKGLDNTRDQSYMLWRLSQSDLTRTLTPLGTYLKKDIREIARKNNLPTAEKNESREICFIPDENYNRFLYEYEQKQGRRFEEGDIVHEDGRILGRHRGIPYYTIGQRRGMGIAHPTPLYVKKIDIVNNRIIVGDNDSLFQTKVMVGDINWVGTYPPGEPFEAEVKIRYKHEAAPALIQPLAKNTARIVFKANQRAVTPGQSAVFYNSDILLGGGIIL